MSTTTARVVYIGRRLLTGQKIAYWYHELDGTDTLGAAKGALQPYQAGLTIGAILEIRHPEDDPTKILIAGPSAPRVVGAWHDPDAVSTWRTQDRADAQIAMNAQRAQKDLQGIPDSFEQALETLGAHFARLNHTQRAALIPLVQSRILGQR